MSGNAELRRRIGRYIRSWEYKGYPDGMPDEALRRLEDAGRVGTYRLICIALMKNDKHLTTLGFARPKCLLYSQIKREELRAKGAVLEPLQLELF